MSHAIAMAYVDILALCYVYPDLEIGLVVEGTLPLYVELTSISLDILVIHITTKYNCKILPF